MDKPQQNFPESPIERRQSIEQLLDIALRAHRAGRLAEAEQRYRQVLAVHPRHAEALHNLGLLAFDSGRHIEAVELMRQAVEARPEWPEANSNLGNVLNALGRREEAIAAQRRAIALRPGFAEAHFNLGNILRDTGHPHEAIAAMRQAIVFKPGWPEAYVNLGNLLRDAGYLDEAIAAHRQAIVLRPDLPEAHYNLGLALLSSGELAEGWEEYEWRWKRRNAAPMLRNFSQPQWDGRVLFDQTLLLHAEQGFGDSIQFIRYLPLARQRCQRVIIECQAELRRLIEPAAGAVVVARGEPLPAFDVHCPLLSLPHIFQTTLETIPRSMPYVWADKALSAKWRERMAGDGSAINVGLAWAGRKTHMHDRMRSMSISVFAPLGKMPGVRLYSLQKDGSAGAVRKSPFGPPLIDHTDQLQDFADTAALIANLDLVISVDTAIAHLAGAMGKPVWVLLPFSPDWRWMFERADSPWYPTMRLFRQPAIGDWESVMCNITHALDAWFQTREDLSPQMNTDGHR